MRKSTPKKNLVIHITFYEKIYSPKKSFRKRDVAIPTTVYK